MPHRAAAQPLPPQLTAPVNDFAHVIDPRAHGEIDRRIRALQEATGDVVVVATVPTFQPYGDIKEYAVKMFENGGKGIGAEAARTTACSIVVAVKDRKVGIEVGYDLEEYITDGFAGRDDPRTRSLPEFRSGNYGAGLLAGDDADHQPDRRRPRRHPAGRAARPRRASSQRSAAFRSG